MASLSSIYIKKDVLELMLKTLEAKKENGISIDVAINDENNDYGQNVSSYVSQTKEQREAKMKRFYIGNGKTFWTDGKIKVADKKQEAETQQAPQQSATPKQPDFLPKEDELNNLPF
jgi:hypothetical protein